MLRDEIEKITDNLYAGYIDRKPAADKLESLFDDYGRKLLEWYMKLTPADKVSVWSKNGEYRGMFNMDAEQLADKFKKHYKP